MAVPKGKISKSRRGQRRGGNTTIVKQNPVENRSTGSLTRSHHVSPDGYYNGRHVTTDKVNH